MRSLINLAFLTPVNSHRDLPAMPSLDPRLRSPIPHEGCMLTADKPGTLKEEADDGEPSRTRQGNEAASHCSQQGES